MASAADLLSCTGRCKCEKVAGLIDKATDRFDLAADAPSERKCRRKLKQSSKRLRKVDRRLGKYLAKACIGPIAGATALQAEAVAVGEQILGSIDAGVCVSAGGA